MMISSKIYFIFTYADSRFDVIVADCISSFSSFSSSMPVYFISNSTIKSYDYFKNTNDYLCMYEY